MWQVLSNGTFPERVKEAKLDHWIDEEWVKKLYQQLMQTEPYQNYIALQERTPAKEKFIIQYIWEKLIWDNEALQEHFSDELPGWEDDKEMAKMLMDNFFKSSQKINFLNLVSGEKKEYAHELLHTVMEKEAYCMELVQPKLINWDADRVALIDLILLRMGVCEMLFFPTIPTKVTINEYIEIAKMYSTPQSGQFVNGVLDNILKDLEKENKIRKQDRVRK
jgi:N utilization substance protein B